MHQTQSYIDMHPGSHISAGQSYSHPATANPLPHYPSYQQQSVMPPGSAHYGPGPSYGGYGYGNQVTSPQSAGPLPSMIPGTGSQHYVPASGAQNPAYASQQVPFDTTGQVAPPGMKPRVTATLWEDEGSLCFQVEAKGVCVARREDNHFINGTKLLNVAGMTRGRRDGILKSEKTRHVVKIGPMHLKGVWIPFERALEFANKEKITDQLYPLFVHNIGGLLYQPENSSRAGAVAAAADRGRRAEGPEGGRPSQSSQTPSMHHHPLQGNAASQLPNTPHQIAPHPTAGRPSLDRAHTFPTPPTSASSVMGINNSSNSYDWSNSTMPNGVSTAQPLSIDTGLNNTRSMPTTPATTPPGSNVQNNAIYPGHQGYDSKHYYATTPSSQTGYAQQQSRYGQSLQDGYSKTDMGPPSAPGSGPADISHDHKSEQYTSGHGSASEPSDHQENGYMSNPVGYGASRPQYAYNATTDPQHLSPEMTSSPSHQNTSRGATPRTIPSNQPSWQTDYQTPPRAATASNLYNVVGEPRGANGAGSVDNYTNSAYSNPPSHGPSLTSKRGRDDDDDSRSGRQDLDGGYKRQKIGSEPFGMPLNPNVHMQAIKTGGGLARQR